MGTILSSGNPNKIKDIIKVLKDEGFGVEVKDKW